MTEDQTLTAVRILSEVVGLAGSIYIVWRWMVPDHAKERQSRRISAWWYRLGEDERKRRGRDRLIFDLREICDSCGCQITREVDRLTYARSR